MKILFITSRLPWPLDKGDRVRAYQTDIQALGTQISSLPGDKKNKKQRLVKRKVDSKEQANKLLKELGRAQMDVSSDEEDEER